MNTDELIDQLARDAKPVVRLPSAGHQFVQWLAFSLVYVGVVMFFYGVRNDLDSVLRDPMFVIHTLLLGVLGVIAGFSALQISVPDRTLSKPLVGCIVALTGLSLFLISFQTCTTPGCEAGHGFACSFHIFILGMAPVIALALMVKRAAPSQRVWSGALMGLSMIGLSASALQFACGNSDPLHLLVWHWLPGFVFVAAGVGVASRLFRW